MSLLTIPLSSLQKGLFRFSPHFVNGLFDFLLLSCKPSLYTLDKVRYQIYDVQIFFSHAVGHLFTFSVVSFEAQRF